MGFSPQHLQPAHCSELYVSAVCCAVCCAGQALGRATEGMSGSDVNTVVKDVLMQPIRILRDATHFRKVRQPDLVHHCVTQRTGQGQDTSKLLVLSRRQQAEKYQRFTCRNQHADASWRSPAVLCSSQYPLVVAAALSVQAPSPWIVADSHVPLTPVPPSCERNPTHLTPNPSPPTPPPHPPDQAPCDGW